MPWPNHSQCEARWALRCALATVATVIASRRIPRYSITAGEALGCLRA